jgi:hypothetical protein
MRRFTIGARIGLAAATAIAATMLLAAPPASAHEQRTVGKYHFLVGWGDEPTYAGFKNSVFLKLSDANDKPVTDLGDTLKVEVSTGDQKITLPVQPNFEVGEFGDAGDYRAWIVPDRPGAYTFHFTGTIHNDKIDETFKSSDTTFDEVKSASEVEFPAKDPTNGDLATRLQRSEARAAAQAKDAKDAASTAKTLGYAGIAVGALGVVIGLVGNARKR